jgi:uncharacterized protein YdaU (DUF1376 family)
MPRVKIQRIDFSASDWLGGTSMLSLQECGLYIRICALIYVAGGPVTKADVRKIAGCRYETLNSVLLRLVEKGKVTFQDGVIDQPRCERELAKARRRIEEARRLPVDNSDPGASLSNGSVQKPAQNRTETQPELLNENIETADPYARAKVYQREREDFKNLEGDLGRSAPARVRAHQGAGIDDMVEQVTAALRGHAPKDGIRDPIAYRATVKENKYRLLMRKVNDWVGCHLDGDARLAGWELVATATADGVHGRTDLPPATRKALDGLIAMYRSTEQLDEAAD